ncbi:hypothetical protein MCANUFG4_01631 [Mycoplasmopsis canis UFG4]|uniref:DUF3899 domain-containing protein n=1 Tax=Mycoplasmopsis canis UFG4 TaxID=1131455 RepID=I1A5H7_9BACT|nr:hypothetical protein [Mycoplasmopsis canis]AKF41508.1 hypothetical protein AAW50_01290 [Mycoplasmopsis canis]EIE40181.1 hypothetical protein MCANUF33_01671 [Mycoplasmopsis canis UF33]EIE41748.1 hypothetical protein MCANUFG4_01631 [Mycoplasmopsis canis UFG4]
MIRNIFSNIKDEFKKKHFYSFFILGIVIFTFIVVAYFVRFPNSSTKNIFSILFVASLVTSLIFIIILLLKVGFWNSISKSYKESKVSVGSYKEERKMLKMSEAEKKLYREQIRKRNQEKINKPMINNIVFYLNSFIFMSLFIIFILVHTFV